MTKRTDDYLREMQGQHVSRLIFEAPYTPEGVDLKHAFPILMFANGLSISIRLSDDEEEFILVDTPPLVVPETIADWSELRQGGWSDRFELAESEFMNSLRSQPICSARAEVDANGCLIRVSIHNERVGIDMTFGENGHSLRFDSISAIDL